MESLKCPITCEIFRDPVIAEDGYTYECNAIKAWFKKYGTSPITGKCIDINILQPNRIIKEIIDEFLTTSSKKHYHFKLDVDIKRSERRPLFQAFGKIIYKAEWVSKPGPPIILLKINGAKASREAEFYVQLSCHPHIVRTYGLVESDSNSVLLLQECALKGDLSELLRENEFRPSQAVLLEIFLQSVDAMICLADNGIVHGDLACRNVLVYRMNNSEPRLNLVKLTDFGLTRVSTLYSVTGSTTSSTLTFIPVRYAAPELLPDTDRPIYSQKSDIYSMGVLMWEAYSQGQLPYASVENDGEVCQRKLRGETLNRPNTCDQALWRIIVQCWDLRPDNRPTFKELRESLLILKFQPSYDLCDTQLEHRLYVQKTTWRDIIPAESHFKSHELADKIRYIYNLKSRSPPQIILGFHDEEEIRRLSINACEHALVVLLKDVGALEHLLMFIRNYITTLNDLAMKINTIQLPCSLRSQLKQLIALRRTLIKAEWFGENDAHTSINQTTKSNELLDAICKSCPNMNVFRALSYEELKRQYLDQSNNEQRKTLEKLWIGKNSIPSLLAKYKLPLTVTDWLHQQKITDIKILTYQQVNELIQLDLKRTQSDYELEMNFQAKQHIANMHDEFKANLMQLYNIEIISRPVKQKKNIEQQCERIAQALQDLSQIRSIDPTNKTILLQELKNIGTRLHVNWYFSKEEMNDANALLETITHDLRSVENMTIIPADNEFRSDEELITHASDGAVVYGIQLMEPNKKISKPLLLPPIYAPLGESIMFSGTKEVTFSSIDDSKRFIQTIEISGFTVALKMQQKFTDLSSGAVDNCAASKLSDVQTISKIQTNSFVHMKCTVIPIHSFRVGKEQIKLSPPATTAINLVTDSTTARKFLSDFGSHVSDGTQHVGGIFIQQITVETKQKTGIETVRRIAECAWSACEQPGYTPFPSHVAPVNEVNLSEYSTETQNKNKIATVRRSVHIIGPSCLNLELFRSTLTNNNMSWCLIDRGTVSSFVPVWEIIEQLDPTDPIMHDVAGVLKRTWLIEASSCVSSESLLCEIDRVRLLQCNPLVPFQTPTLEKSNLSTNIRILVHQLNSRLNEHFDPESLKLNDITEAQILSKVSLLIVFTIITRL